MVSTWCYFFLVMAIAHQTFGYSTGAPEDACKDMTPQHHVDPQKSAAPYTLTVSRKTIRSGDEVTLTITGNSANDKIKGFMIQARQGEQPVGSFKVASNDNYVQPIDCLGGKNNAVTHKKHEENDDKRSITVTWVSPKNLKGDVQFRATVALNGGIFWVGLRSNSIKIY